ncbi:MAG: heparinase II/III family protein [Lachnospiraceae bacterium]|nr:heparinase II/III family protein [Lachnospiraceae bacterium]
MFAEWKKKHSFSEFDFSKKLFPNITEREYWETYLQTDCVADAEGFLDYSWAPVKATDFMEFLKSGNRKIMEDVYYERRRALITLCFGELTENQGRFLPQIVNGIFSVCEESYWGLSAHWFAKPGNIPTPQFPYIDLYAAETGAHLAIIYDLFLKPLSEFCPEILTRMEYEIERRIMVPYLTHKDFFFMGYYKKPNNWNPWIISNLLTVFLVMEKNRRRLDDALEKMFDEIQFYYQALPEDGGCDEGPKYWGKSGATLFEFLYQLKLATDGKINLFADEKIKKVASYMKKVHIYKDRFVNFADCHASDCSDLIGLIYLFGRETQQKDIMNFGAEIYHQRASSKVQFMISMRRNILEMDAVREMQEYSTVPIQHEEVELLNSLQVVCVRKDTLFVGAKGGHNAESHNHNDVGNFVFYDNETPILVDAGIGAYTRFTFDKKYRYTSIPWVQSTHHNLPLINGVEQKNGKEYGATRFEVKDSEIAVEFSGAYPEEAGINSLVRTIKLEKNALLLEDDFIFSDESKQEVTEYFITNLPVHTSNGEAILGECYRMTVEGGKLECEFLSFEGDELLCNDWNAKGLTRIAIKTDKVKRIRIKIKCENI